LLEKLRLLRQDQAHVKEQQGLAKRNKSSDEKKEKLQSFLDEINKEEKQLIDKSEQQIDKIRAYFMES